MKNNTYWKQRFEALEQSQNQKGLQCYADIEKQYRQAQRTLEGQISSWYQRFADNNKISLSEARRMLTTKELAEFKWDVQDYIKFGEENAINGTWTKQLENASARYHISRLESLKLQTQQGIEVLFGNQIDAVDATMHGIYKRGYYHTAFEIQKGVGVGWNFSTLNDKQISKVINKPWAADGKNFSAHVWVNRQKLVNELNTILTQNIILGRDPQKVIDEIARKMQTSKVNAGRLVMTEGAFFSSAAQKDCFSELGVEQFEIVATLDSHTSDICQTMDGKHFPMSQWEVGVTAPPFHVYCRSTTVPYFGDKFDSLSDRAARGADGKTYYVPGGMTYPEWKKSFVDGGDKTGLQPVSQGGIIKVNSSAAVQRILDRYPLIKGTHSPSDDIRATNPKYLESKKNKNTHYTHNCQRCVNAYEARRRGYNVTAATKYQPNDPLAYMANEKGWANVYNGGKESLVPCISNSADGVRKKVTDTVLSWGDGARGIVRVQWKGSGGGHVFIAECHGEEVVFLDPQSGRMDASPYFDLVKIRETYLLRTDDKEFSTLIERCCETEGGKK